MGWSIGYNSNLKRDIGYGVPATCDHPECSKDIDRGIAYTCGGEPEGGDRGCGLNFCESHLSGGHSLCARCLRRYRPFAQKPDHPEWIEWKLADASWQKWRDEHPGEVDLMRKALPATT